MQTKLIYMEHMQQFACVARVLSIQADNGLLSIILDQTVFYPQGGGQPYDVGSISSRGALFQVKEVRYVNGVVYHIGTFEIDSFGVGDTVTCEIDINRRKINTRLHSIGHLIDIAIQELNLNWEPAKGYHFPEGAYIEYRGNTDGKDLVELVKEIETKSNNIVSRKIDTRIEFSKNNTQDGKPLRTVYYGDFGVPCGGTHVKNLEDIVSVTIRKIKQDKDKIRVSYA